MQFDKYIMFYRSFGKRGFSLNFINFAAESISFFSYGSNKLLNL